MQVIGITGGSGSGKSVICHALAERGYTIIDADKIAREIVEPGQPALNELSSAFDDVLLANGQLDRKKLAGIVFHDAEKLKILNEITHKYITKEIRRRIDVCNSFACIIDAPLLYEAGLSALCDTVIGVTADKAVRLNRIIARDGLSLESAEGRLNAQGSIEANLSRVDYVIDTTEEVPVAVHAQKIDRYIKGELHEKN